MGAFFFLLDKKFVAKLYGPERYKKKKKIKYEIQVKFGEKKIADFSCPKKNLIFVSLEKKFGVHCKKHTLFPLQKKGS